MYIFKFLRRIGPLKNGDIFPKIHKKLVSSENMIESTRINGIHILNLNFIWYYPTSWIGCKFFKNTVENLIPFCFNQFTLTRQTISYYCCAKPCFNYFPSIFLLIDVHTRRRAQTVNFLKKVKILICTLLKKLLENGIFSYQCQGVKL